MCFRPALGRTAGRSIDHQIRAAIKGMIIDPAVLRQKDLPQLQAIPEGSGLDLRAGLRNDDRCRANTFKGVRFDNSRG